MTGDEGALNWIQTMNERNHPTLLCPLDSLKFKFLTHQSCFVHPKELASCVPKISDKNVELHTILRPILSHDTPTAFDVPSSYEVMKL